MSQLSLKQGPLEGRQLGILVLKSKLKDRGLLIIMICSSGVGGKTSPIPEMLDCATSEAIQTNLFPVDKGYAFVGILKIGPR
jgi:hypothetical protein